ncbi:MAG: creatininase family protein, partial [Elioraea tepidiphila]
MNTSPRIDSCLPAVDEAATQLNAAVLWHHAAFCGLGLPLRTPRAAWQRSAGGVTVRIEPGTGEVPLPAGPMLRLVLLHVCDAAFRAESPVVALGADALVAPVLPFGGEDYFGTVPGGIALSHATLLAVIREMLERLLAHGLDRILIVNGHGGNTHAI